MQPMYVGMPQHVGKDRHKHCKYRAGDIENLCKAKDVGLQSSVLCLEKNPGLCACAFSDKGSFYCSCRPRVYIAKVLQKK